MNDDRILEIAETLNAYCLTEYENGTKYECYEFTQKELIAFARAIAAEQRECDAKILEQNGWLLQAADVIRNQKVEG